MKSLWIAALLALAAQDKPSQAPPPPLPSGRAPTKFGADFPELKRGELPADTTADVRKAWDQIVRASLPNAPKVEDAAHPPPLPARAPITAFDLSIDVRYRASDTQSNDMPSARYRWLAPGFFRADTGRGRSHLRGPNGSFLIDTSKSDHPETISLAVSRENVEDRRQLEEEAGLASNFAGLADARSLRIARLVSVGAPMSTLPESLQQRARELTWLELDSPDFSAVHTDGKAASMARVQLGIDPKTNQPEVAVVQDAARPAGISASTSVLQLQKYTVSEDFFVPRRVLVWLPEASDPDRSERRLVLRQKPAMEMYVTKATLRATLKPEDFLP